MDESIGDANRERAARERVENFEGLVRAQQEWVEVLRVFAEAPTAEDGAAQLVSKLGFSSYQAMAIRSSLAFRDLVGEQRQLFARKLQEARRQADASTTG